MRTSHFLVTALFAAIPVMSLAAQGPVAVTPSELPPSSAKAAPQDLSTPDALSNVTVRQTGPNSFAFDVKPGAKKLDSAAVKELNEAMKQLIQARSTMTKNSTLCYSMQGYRFTRPDPTSDATTLTAKSTCQPSTQFQSRSIVVKPGNAPGDAPAH